LSDDAISQLERLLREEREAIRRLDGAKVLELAREKESFVALLGGKEGALDSDQKSRLRALVPMLRHNGILLAHARDILRDAIAATRAVQRPAMGAAQVPRLPTRVLSVRG
jgi:hypothetical protein